MTYIQKLLLILHLIGVISVMNRLYVTYCNKGNLPMNREVSLFTVLPCKYPNIHVIGRQFTNCIQHCRLS